MARAVGGAAIALGVGLGPGAGPLAAQISPGKLSRGHVALEGSTSCLKCHDADQGLAPAKCLACHGALGERIGAKQGLHARPEYRDCRTCHVEHQGVDYDLVWWGKAGRERFDHRSTGYVLEGKHARLACDSCHQKRFLQGGERLARAGTNLDRTFLGLLTECRSCHPDEHRGQFKTRSCEGCHASSAWRPAPGFDHAKTAYPLTGRHTAVACEKCHTSTAKDAAGSFRRFQIAGWECAGCHADVHKGRFGAACGNCHATAGWRQQKLQNFDHDRTGYPLKGRHAAVVCDKCHRAGRPLRIPFAKCTDCHADAHLGQLAQRADQGRCESCHDLAGFTPANFSVEDHQKTAFVLAGGHLAVPCNACHRWVGPERQRAIPGLAASASAPRTIQLRFPSTGCAACHEDPHLGELDARAGADGCPACHKVLSWHDIVFDHAKTRFALSFGHARLACAKCHPRAEKGTAKARLRLVGTPLGCEGCHQDPHEGQLRKAGQAATCEACHSAKGWRVTSFDHARDAAFALDGAHVALACGACHGRERAKGEHVRYKPLPRTCKGCHGDLAVPKGTEP